VNARAVVLIALGALLGAGGAGGAPTGGTPVAFVALPHQSQLVAVAVGSGEVLRRVRVPRGPQEVTDLQGLSRVLVTSPSAGALTLVDAFSQRVVKVWRGLGTPTDVAVSGNRAFVTDRARGRLVVIDLITRRVVARIPVGPRPRAVVVGDVAIVAHEGSSSLSLVDVRRRSVVRLLSVGEPVHALSRQPDTANVFVTYRSGAVALVDWGRGRVIFRRDLNGAASDILKDIYVGDNVWVGDSSRDRLLLLSARDGRLRRTFRGCAGIHRLAQVGTASIVGSCRRSKSIAVWGTTRRGLTSIPLQAEPAGVAIAVLP
jgi:YVTN family beta-propeller protein